MGKETRALIVCHWVLLCTERATVWSLSFPLCRVFFLSRSRSRFLSRSLSLSLSFFFSLPLLLADMCLSLFLSLSLALRFSRSLFSRSLALFFRL